MRDIFLQKANVVTPLHPAWHNWLARETFTIIVISRLRVRASPWEFIFCDFLFASYINLRTTSRPLKPSFVGSISTDMEVTG